MGGCWECAVLGIRRPEPVRDVSWLWPWLSHLTSVMVIFTFCKIKGLGSLISKVALVVPFHDKDPGLYERPWWLSYVVMHV